MSPGLRSSLQVIDYTREDPAALLGDCDAAFDTVGGASVAQTFAVLKPGGRAAFIAGGADAPDAPREDVTALRPAVNRSRALMDRVTGYVEAGILRLPSMSVANWSSTLAIEQTPESSAPFPVCGDMRCLTASDG